MLKRMFGGASKPVATEPKKVDVQASIKNLQEQTEKLEMRQKVLEAKSADLKASAL